MKLNIELVPSTSWYNNLRKVLNTKEWEKCKSYAKKQSNNRCYICGGVGTKWPVECHEEWEYDESKGIQKLKSINSLCPDCHMVKHIGLAQIQGNFEKAIKHFMKINDMDFVSSMNYLQEVKEIWNKRNKQKWNLDLKYIKKINKELGFDKESLKKISEYNGKD